jgi:hypothetical protein
MSTCNLQTARASQLLLLALVALSSITAWAAATPPLPVNAEPLRKAGRTAQLTLPVASAPQFLLQSCLAAGIVS